MDINALKTESFQLLVQNFEQWLSIIGYSQNSVYGMPNCIIELLYYLENTGNIRVKDINNQLIKEYYSYLKKRQNKTKGGILKNSSLNKHIHALHKFNEFVRQSGIVNLPLLYIPQESKNERTIDVLDEDEIVDLFKASYFNKKENNQDPINARDRAMLCIFYSCGLRRNEGYHLNVSDLNFKRRILYVRNGKNYSERIVPFNRTNAMYLEEYIQEARPKLCNNDKVNALFVTQRARRMKGQSLLLRLKTLIARTENKDLQEKEVGLHTLRHSIASHLLARGMKLQNISTFLGHRTLEATQIYTHLMDKENGSF